MSGTKGIIFVEARMREDVVNDPNVYLIRHEKLQSDLESQLSSENQTFEILEDILDDPRNAQLKLGPFYEQAQQTLCSLRVVEYQGPATNLTCYSSENVRVEVQVYTLCNTPRSLDGNLVLPQAEITTLPHSRFVNQWDELVFGNDIKDDLIWMMINILKFSRRFDKGEMNPLILLYGPPGTGKTTLCQALAQKISIRLNSTYKQTRLVQIKTATLLSKFYSESARQVDEIFTKIARMCEEDAEEFICVLIDEVESIASSREFSIKNGESQDSLRATNALLTGLDRTKTYANVIFLCTSNMVDVLDSAFLDRCGLMRSIEPPSMASQYEILRSRIQKLIKREVIESSETIPSYDDAVLEANARRLDRPGCKLLALVESIRSGNAHAKSGTELSGRCLIQIPEQAILRYLRSERCDLEMSFAFMEKMILSEQNQGLIPEESPEGACRKKRKLSYLLEDDCDAGTSKRIGWATEAQSLGDRHKLSIEERSADAA